MRTKEFINESTIRAEKLNISEEIQMELDINNTVVNFLIERPIRATNAKKNRERTISKPTTRNKLKRKMERPTVKRKMQAGYQRWLKRGGREHLSDTAAKRFEAGLSFEDSQIMGDVARVLENTPSYDWRDINLIVKEKMIDVDELIEQFSVNYPEELSMTERVKFLYENFHDDFIRIFTERILLAGIIIDPDYTEDQYKKGELQEDTLSTDIARGDGQPNPWVYPDKNIMFPLIYKDLKSSIRECVYLLEELIDDEDDVEFIDEVNTIIDELSFLQPIVTLDEQVNEEVTNFLEYMLECYFEMYDAEPQIYKEAIDKVSDLQLNKIDESLFISIVESGLIEENEIFVKLAFAEGKLST